MKIGDIVNYALPAGTLVNGSEKHPAMITRVWSDDMVNLKVFFDCGDVETRGSVYAKHSKHWKAGQGYFEPHGL